MGLKSPEVQTEGGVQLEFTLTDTSYPFVGATATTDARLALEEMVPRSDGTYAEYFSVAGESPHDVLEIAEEHDGSTARVLSATADGGLLELEVERNCPMVTLADAGAIPRVVRSEGGEGRIVAEVPDAVDTNAVTSAFLEAYPTAELRARRQHDPGASPFQADGLPDALETPLSDCQREALRVAHEAGYYEWPRDVTAEEVAETLDISAPTFHQHRRAAERKVVDVLVGAAPSVNGTDGSA